MTEQLELLVTKEAASRLGKTPGSLMNDRSAGRGCRYIKIGRKVFYTPELISEYINSCIVDPAAPVTRSRRKGTR